MPLKKKRFVIAQRFFKKYGLFFSALFTVLNVILFVLPLIVGQEFVIVKIITIHYINLDQTVASAHGISTLTQSISATITIRNASGTYTFYGK